MANRNITTNNDTEVRKEVLKRFLLAEDANQIVFDFIDDSFHLQWVKEGNTDKPKWEDAIEYLIRTHPRTKHL